MSCWTISSEAVTAFPVSSPGQGPPRPVVLPGPGHSPQNPAVTKGW